MHQGDESIGIRLSFYVVDEYEGWKKNGSHYSDDVGLSLQYRDKGCGL